LAADAARALDDRDRERALLNQVLAEPTTRLDRLAAWERLAALELQSGAPDKAASWYAAIAQQSQVPDYRATMLLKAATALLAAHATDAGERRLLQLATTLPDTPAAYQGLQQLLAADPAVFSTGHLGYDTACRIAYAAGQYQEAIGYCESFRTLQAPGPGRADAAWYTARAYEAAGNPTQAAAWYQGFTAVYTADARLPEALLHWGNVLAASGDGAGALGVYDQLVGSYARNPAAAAAHDQAGLILRRQGDLASAADRWRSAADAPGAGDDLRARALFWRGWALQQQGQAADAAATWRQGAPYFTFWGQRSADHLSAATLVPRDTGLSAPDRARLLALAAPAGARQAEDDLRLLRWAAAWSPSAPAIADPQSVPTRLAGDPAYTRALALAHVALWPEAGLAFADLAATLEHEGDGTALAALALAARQADAPWLAASVTRSLQRTAQAAGRPAGLADLPRAAQEMLYPAVWPHLLATDPQAQQVDPWLLLALVRQESAYDPRALSSSSARGLTQVIPDTATGIAAALHVAPFDQGQLYRPAVSLAFGGYYLNQTLAQFDRNILYALAGYNAGPGNVPAWAGGRVAGDPDLFVDNIDYAETRDYVQIVYTNYAIYRWLYAR
ncbi:MAG TPA: transglycosylase SLT domain-containing protein, partial [Chloroflexia bacterium]|nr:transglycosylase SLT domain-containing protein [Chloroflexia bacterium]